MVSKKDLNKLNLMNEENAVMEQNPSVKSGRQRGEQMTKKLFLFLVFVLFAFSSCTTYKGFTTFQNVEVKLDAYSNKENASPNKKVALMICNDENIPKHDLKNLELEGYIKKVLDSKGYTFTKNQEEANIIIFYEYGISDPKVYTSQRIVPIWGQTGVSSSTTETRYTYSGKPYQHTTYTPNYGKIGENVVTDTKIKYLRWVNISAFDADYYRKTGEDKMLWLTEIQSEGESDDLRYIFPYMLVAAKEYIGQNVNNRISVNIPNNPADKQVLEVKDALVTIIINQATAGYKDPQATVYQNVYKNGELFIKAGTPVNIKNRKRIKHGLILSKISTTSVYGNNINFNGGYYFAGKDNSNIRHTGFMITVCSTFILSPIGVPLWCVGDAHAKIPAGTLLYLEME